MRNGFLLREKSPGVLDKGVATTAEIGATEADEVVGGNAELGVLLVAVVHRAGREAHGPTVRQFA